MTNDDVFGIQSLGWKNSDHIEGWLIKSRIMDDDSLAVAIWNGKQGQDAVRHLVKTPDGVGVDGAIAALRTLAAR